MLDINTILDKQAAVWMRRFKGHDARILKALALVKAGSVHVMGASEYCVYGVSDAWYTVRVSSGYPSCECADFRFRKTRCAHIHAAALAARLAESVDEALPPTPPAPKPLSLNAGLESRCKLLHAQNEQARRRMEAGK